MNKRQKEILQSQLDNEKDILDRLKKIYEEALDEIDEHTAALFGRADTENIQSIIYRADYQKALKGQISAALDKLSGRQFTSVSEYLESCYENGFLGAMYDIAGQGIPLIIPVSQAQAVKAVVHDTKLSGKLYNHLGEDVDQLKKKVSGELTRGIAQGMSYSDVAKRISNGTNVNLGKSMRIVRTEGNRITNEAVSDAQHKAKKKGADILKQWCSVMDKCTRPDHQQLDGQLRELDEEFEVKGRKVMRPGAFGVPEEDINCRCQLLQRAKWGLDGDELEELKRRAEFFELDKAENFQDFLEKYLDAVDNIGESGIIEVEEVQRMNLIIDKFTPCLEDTETGEFVPTIFEKASKKDLSDLKGWNFNWLDDELIDADIYKLCLKDDETIQGLVSVTDFKRDMAVYVNIAESAPHNIGKGKRFNGVGGHLFAIAAQISVEKGYGGFVFMDAKNTELVKHYNQTLGAVLLGRPHPYRMFIDEESAAALLDTYTFEEE